MESFQGTSRRLIIRLANLAAIPQSLTDPLQLTPTFTLTNDYFQAVSHVLNQSPIRPQLLSMYDLGKQQALLTHAVVGGVSTQTSTTINLRPVFEHHYTELKQLYEGATNCVTLKEANFFNIFYVYLDPDTAELLTGKLTNVGIAVTEATPAPFFLRPSNPASSSTSFINYLQLMGITDDVWNKSGGQGEYANCVLAEESFLRIRSRQPELCPSTLTLPILNDDRRTQQQWDAILDQLPLPSGLGGFGSEDHSNHTLSVLVASHDYHSTTPDKYKGIVPSVTLQRLVSMYQPPQNTTIPIPHPEIALLKAILYASRGAILLIEYQLLTNRNYLAIETNYASFWLIYIATHCFDITVIEPIGNSVLNIDGKYEPELLIDGFLDAGSILVGGATANQNKYNYTTSQTQRFVFAPTPVDVFPSQQYLYDGTSAASAIIAGIACQLQSIYFGKHGTYLPPVHLRNILCTYTTNSKRIYPPGSRSSIGIMPNVADMVELL